ncbi:unnamed protein product [marine sediment metagenome]|uniref:Uncharacterized protein n=1 Tax=marine sediment metagenome TaxID=412755 RepID=X1C557_9ZZZZ
METQQVEPTSGEVKSKADENLVRDLYEKNKKEIMREVHQPNAFGQTEVYVAFFKDRVDIDIHPTPSRTVYEREEPIFELYLGPHPFFTYEELDTLFEQSIEDDKLAEEIEAELNETKEIKDKRFLKKAIDIDKLKQLVKETDPYAHPHCADCASELKYCPTHQKAEAYLDRFFDRGSNEFEEHYKNYIVI